MTATISAWARRGATAVAAGRVAIGVVALVAPPVVARPWVGDAGGTTEGRLLARTLGGRDLALGLGALAALTGQNAAGSAVTWVGLAAVADVCDTVATAAAWRTLPATKWLVAATAAGAAAIGAVAAWSMVDGEPTGAA
ncbi:MAG TPA: hypothetical protein VGH27_03145 [Streptosporangiaceae bacterium]|jgi:hypothetical protein